MIRRLFLLLLLLVAAPAQAREMTAEDVSAWLDGIMPASLARSDMAGAEVVVVKDGAVLAAKGWGWADVARKVPVDPDRTLFRLASVSKLFTWTAVMQQVEQGKLDLDADINRYLDFRIAPTFGKPITLRHLMTHSAGFEEQGKGMFFDDAARLLPLGEYVKRRLPARIFPPGEVTAYSNYGSSLAAYIVERVSGEPFEAYAERHIFRPLGMNRTSFRQPLPAGMRGDLSTGYGKGPEDVIPLAHLQPWPGGSAAATGADMARFMIAHLEGSTVLRPATFARMHSRANTIAPGLNGWAHGFWEEGFWEEGRGGVRLIAHGGNLDAFHTWLMLAPEKRVGIYVAINSDGRAGDSTTLRLALLRGFFERYYPAPLLAPEPTLASAARDGRALEGRYLPSRRGETSFQRLANLKDQPRVRAWPDGTLTFDAYKTLGGGAIRWREIAPDRWREVGGTSRLAVVRDGRGAVRYLYSDAFPPSGVYQPAPASEDAGWVKGLLWLVQAVLAVGVLAIPPLALWRRRLDRWTMIAPLAALLTGTVLHVWLKVIPKVPDTGLNEDLDGWLRLLQVGGVAGAVLGVVVLVHAIRAKERPWSARALEIAVGVAILAAVWAQVAFHLWAVDIRY